MRRGLAARSWSWRSVGVGAFAATAWIAGGDDEAPAATATAPPPLARLTDHLPRGIHDPRDGRPRRRGSRDRDPQARRHAAAHAGRLPRARSTAPVAPPRFRKDVKRDSLEGFLFPASYEFTQTTTARSSSPTSSTAFRQRFRDVDLSYARSKNLTPYDVLIIASMIEKETAVPRERRLVAAVIYNRLRNRMPLGIDATIRYGLDIPGTESLTKAALRIDSPFNTRPSRAAADAHREPRPRLDPRRGEPGADVDYLYYVRKPKSIAHYFTANESDFLRKVCEYGYACD